LSGPSVENGRYYLVLPSSEESWYYMALPYAVMVWTGTTLLSPGSGCKFSFWGRATTKQLSAASCMEILSKINVGWDLASVLS
jgi:hypothetical protein